MFSLNIEDNETYGLLSLILQAKFDNPQRYEMISHPVLNKILRHLESYMHDIDFEDEIYELGSDFISSDQGTNFVAIVEMTKLHEEPRSFGPALKENLFPYRISGELTAEFQK